MVKANSCQNSTRRKIKQNIPAHSYRVGICHFVSVAAAHDDLERLKRILIEQFNEFAAEAEQSAHALTL